MMEIGTMLLPYTMVQTKLYMSTALKSSAEVMYTEVELLAKGQGLDI